jgi:hypothetical protein
MVAVRLQMERKLVEPTRYVCTPLDFILCQDQLESASELLTDCSSFVSEFSMVPSRQDARIEETLS